MALTEIDKAGKLQKAGKPVLFLGASLDKTIPVSTVRYFFMQNPGSNFVEIEGSGHSPILEDSKGFSAALFGFSKDVGKRRELR